MRRSTVSLAAILIVAAALRFAGLGSGIPYAIGVDEPQIVDRAVGMMKSGSFNPHFYDYPSLYIYVQVCVISVRFLAGATAGRWTSLDQVTSADFFPVARSATAVLGTLTVLLLYQIGLRWGTRPALLAAGLLAVMPLHVRESHYALTDVPMTFLVTLTFLLTLRAHERMRAPAFGWAGVAAGLAAATKYPGALAIVLPLTGVWMTPGTRPTRLAGSLAAVAGAAAAFLLAAPYTVLDLPAFLNGYARLAGMYVTTPISEPAWSLYLKHLRNSVEWPAFLLMLGGAVLAAARAVRGPGRTRWALAVVFPILFFGVLSQQSLIYGRYLLPLVPFVCMLAAAAVVSGVSLLRRFSIPRSLRTALIAALTVATILPALVDSVRFVRNVRRTGTPALAFEWITRNVPAQSAIVIEPGGPVLAYSPYRASIVRQLRERDFQHYEDSGAVYLIASSQCYGPYFDAPQRFPREYADYMRLFGQGREVARFSPTADHPGPEIRILKVRP